MADKKDDSNEWLSEQPVPVSDTLFYDLDQKIILYRQDGRNLCDHLKHAPLPTEIMYGGVNHRFSENSPMCQRALRYSRTCSAYNCPALHPEKAKPLYCKREITPDKKPGQRHS